MRIRRSLGLWLLGLGACAALPLASGMLPQITQAQPTPQPSPTASPIPEKPSVPYVPTPESVVTEMLKLANVTNNDVVYDLGSGDGRLVIAAVKEFGAKRGVGVEINPGLVRRSNEAAQQAGVGDRVQFVQQDLFKTDFRDASVVTLYLLPDVNVKLRPKLLNDLKPGTRIVSHSFTMGDWKPDKTLLVPNTPPQRILYYWVVPANITGDWKGNLSYGPNRSQAYTLRFTQQYQEVKGSVLANKQTFGIPQVTLTGNRLTFSRTETIQGQKFTVVFNGTVEGDTLQGVAELQGGVLSRKYPITAKRTSTRQALK